jgi:hypothetical protein
VYLPLKKIHLLAKHIQRTLRPYLQRKSPMTIQNNNYDVDYSQFYLDAKKAFEAIPEAVNNKNYAEAEQCALDAMVEIKLVWHSLQLLREKNEVLWGKKA